MVGSAILRSLNAQGYRNTITATHAELDLCDQEAVRSFLSEKKPNVIINAAGRVGGIHANSTYPAQFIRDNLAIALDLVHEGYEAGVSRLLFLGSTCIYPRMAPQPIAEDALLSGPLEPTNEAYALAKIAGLKLCQHYRNQYGVCYHSVMPTNMYGPRDNYDAMGSHVLPALIRRFHEAKQNAVPEVTIWGSGSPTREFLYVDDCADAIVFLLGLDDPPDVVNIGTGTEVTIRELAETVQEVVGYAGQLVFDTSKPDGTPRKLCDSSKLRSLGWASEVSLRDGLEKTYACFLEELSAGTLRGT